ncbi:unnamed protein product [Cylicocyclus nassatus]|uniref:EGF-like domain-containing protein n=1 Tax=Cylicocyclus nassatus TaxID=53992 RepID=A0AA36DL63_CYLNA|nr:unnamed protein product [Cylicocyclus nassatus]
MDVTTIDCADGIPTVGSFVDEPYFYALLWALLIMACVVAMVTLAVTVRSTVRVCRIRRWKPEPMPAISVLDRNPLDQMPHSVDRSFCFGRCNERGVCFMVDGGSYRCVCYDAEASSPDCGSGATSTVAATAAGAHLTYEQVAALAFGFAGLYGFKRFMWTVRRRRPSLMVTLGRSMSAIGNGPSNLGLLLRLFRNYRFQ